MNFKYATQKTYRLYFMLQISDPLKKINFQDQTRRISTILDKKLYDYLEQLTDLRRDLIISFYNDHKELINTSKGSKTKHQAWDGGYADHIAEVFRIAEVNYNSYNSIRELPFTLDSAIIVLMFHDVEKIWSYTTGLPVDFDKDYFYDVELKERYNISFSDEERNALHYVHGELGADYNPYIRKAGPLAAFCHAADHLSARMWFDEGQGLGA